MKEIREVVITIKDETSPSKGAQKKEAEKPDTPAPEGDEKTSENGNVDAVASILAVQAFNIAKNSAVSIARYEISKYFALNDDYISQQGLNNALSCVHRGLAVATATIAGAKFGGAIGAVIGFVGSTAGMAVQAYQAIDQQNLSIRTTSAYQSFQYSRRGEVLTNGSIGDNL